MEMENTRRYICVLIFFTFIYGSAGGIAPAIYKLMADKYTGTVSIECMATGVPKPEVTWTFNDAPIHESSHYDLRYQNRSMLVIRDSTFADSGKYTCHARNSYGKIFQELDLKIKGLGKFEKGFRREDDCQYRNVTIGRPFVLPCPLHTKAYGQQIKWVNEPFDQWRPGYPLRTVFQARNGNLIFSYIKKSDIRMIESKGGIACTLILGLTLVPSVSIKLHPVGNEFKGTAKPTISVFMKTRTEVVAGSPVSLLCGAIGKPHPKLVWKKNDKTIPLDGMLSDMTVKGKGMVIELNSVLTEHEGVYKCIATNSAGEDMREATLVVNLRTKWKKRLAQRVELKYKESIKLQCIAEGKPKPTYTWMHNDTIITSTANRKIKDGLLEVPVADFRDSGFYLCIAENKVNKMISGGYVDVQAFPPSIVTQFDELYYFITGTRNTLRCDATGGPEPAIRWYHNDVPLVGGSQATIVLDNIQKSSNGVYKCVASNSEGSEDRSTVIKVFDRTRITRAPANFTFQEGSVANLFCEAEYDDTLKVTFEWLKDGKKITYDSRVKLWKGIKWSTNVLHINYVIVDDAGMYTCRVFTEDDASFRSQDEKTGSITVIETPGKPPRDVKIVGDCSNVEVDLTWSAPSKNIAVDYYIIEYANYNNNSSKWYAYESPNKITGTSLTIKTTRLPSSTTIKFRVKAVTKSNNEKIISQAGEGTHTCTVGPGAPFAAPMGLKVTMDSDDNLTVSWDEFNKMFQSGKGFKIVGTWKEIVNGTEVYTKQVNVKGNDTSFQIPVGDLNGNDAGKYEIAVYGENEQGAGPKAEITVEHPGNLVRPRKVGNVRVDSVTETSVSLKWGKDKSASGYMVYYYEPKSGRRRRNVPETTEKKRIGSKKVTGGKNGTTIDGLAPNSEYEITVAAQNVRGEGPESDPVRVKTKKGLPGIPKGVYLKTYGKTIVLTWSPLPKEDDVTNYTVTWYPSGETNPAKRKSKEHDPESSRAFITSGLEPFTYYTVELNAVNDIGKGKSWTMAGVVVGKADQPGKPDPPSLTPYNVSTINVIFNLPTKAKNTGGLPNKFTVYYEKEGPASDKMSVSAAYPEENSVLLLDLELANYKVWTVAENDEGRGEPSGKVDGMPLEPTTTPMPTTTTPLPSTSTTPNITVANVTVPVGFSGSKAGFYSQLSELWFIILIALFLIILVIALIICVVMNHGNAGKYPVGEKEKKYGGWDNNQQLHDYSDGPLDKPKDSKVPVRSVSESSIAKVPILDDYDDNDSLDYYQDDNKFNEDGSFIYEYGDEKESYTNNALL